MRTLMASLLLPLVVPAAGCATHPLTRYLPLSAYRTTEAVFPAAPYSIDGDDQKGTVQLIAFDGERLPVGPRGAEVYLHLRLHAENRGDSTPWQLNPNDQILAGEGAQVSPAFAQTSAGPPVLTVTKGARGWLDLYYPLPDDHDPLDLALTWRVRRGDAVLAHRTHLLRMSGRDPEPPYEYVAAAAPPLFPTGLALGWWWPDSCFSGHGAGGYRRAHSPRRPSGGSAESPSGDWSRPEYASSSSSDSSGSSSQPAYPASETASDWRNPSAPAPPPGESGGGSSSSDSSKSAWRR
jgi:hypothetical protein